MRINFYFLLIIVCIASLLVQGCYSSFLASDEERKKLVTDPSEQIEINLANGSTVRADPYHYLEVSGPSDFVFGVGEQLDRTTRRSTPFRGKISAPYVDSCDTTKIYNSRSKIIRHIIRLPDSSVVRFEKDNYIAVKSDQGPGLWCVGHKTGSKLPGILLFGLIGSLIEPNGDPVNGRMPFDQIKSIEVRKFSTLKTILFGLAVSAEIALLAVVAHNAPRY
ncbi:MAG: hypothetical protein HY033_08905 [Ignavibacteriae bacterium]|nr:hypothetical protein [Ignavibacteria bacterium]MBI3365010.1 hypothetical protein [Ignavibacteriota bacterium]